MAERAQGSKPPQEIDVLRKRYEKLSIEKITNENELKNRKEQLEKLQREAREKWETDDIAALEKKLEDMKRENQERRRTYQDLLDGIDAKLTEISKTYSDATSKAPGK